MGISQLLADSAFARLFRGHSARAELIVSMVGVKLGERLLVVGLSDPALPATLGAKVGLTGRACAVDADAEAVARARRRAAREGVLVDIEQARADALPYESDSFDILVVRAAGPLAEQPLLAQTLGDGARILRDGGRALVLLGGRTAWMTRGGGPPPRLEGTRVTQLLADRGYRGARILAERDGLTFVEAVARR
jgi:SAM-dependent methyltransferase